MGKRIEHVCIRPTIGREVRTGSRRVPRRPPKPLGGKYLSVLASLHKCIPPHLQQGYRRRRHSRLLQDRELPLVRMYKYNSCSAAVEDLAGVDCKEDLHHAGSPPASIMNYTDVSSGPQDSGRGLPVFGVSTGSRARVLAATVGSRLVGWAGTALWAVACFAAELLNRYPLIQPLYYNASRRHMKPAM